MAQKPSIPRGTRDFSPAEMVGREYIFDTIKKIFRKYGYAPLETPAMENLSTLLGKYGEEGDKLLFKVLNSGDFIRNIPENVWKTPDSHKILPYISEKGLRFDLTVPFARYVVQHRNEITFPFKRYQIQPVWRADKPQKGRYREFYQCDVDVIGSDSSLNEVELLQINDEVFRSLGINTLTKCNNRKILAGISELMGASDQMTDITIAIDKHEKIGIEGVKNELKEKGLSDSAIEKLEPVFGLSGTNEQKLQAIENIVKDSEIGRKGVQEMRELFSYLSYLELDANMEFDVKLARGLNYYTGSIFEVKASDVELGSICGGGRYDDLTGIFGLKDVSGVGISFGADRIYDVMEKLDVFPNEVQETTRLMFVNFGGAALNYCLALAYRMRQEGVSCEIYPEASKMKKQMNYANKKDIPFVAIVGEDELQQNKVTLKDMQSGEQKTISWELLVNEL